MNNNQNNSYGTCGNNGRIAINGYHGQNSLDLYKNRQLVGNVAALSALNVNLSNSCTPALTASAASILNQVINNPTCTQSIMLTNGSSTAGLGAADFFATMDVNEATLTPQEIEDTLYQFFGQNCSSISGNCINTKALPGVTFSFNISVTGNETCGFTATININASTLTSSCSNNLPAVNSQLGQFTLVSNAFVLDDVIQTSPSLTTLQSNTISFSQNSQCNNSVLFVIGDSIVQLGSLPIFSIQASELVDSSTDTGVLEIVLVQPLQLNIVMNTLTNFITCNNASSTCTVF